VGTNPDSLAKASGSAGKAVKAAGSVGGSFGRPLSGWRLRLYTVIFEADTPAGRAFDYLLIAAIVTSVGVVIA
jgi:hypothetical protein